MSNVSTLRFPRGFLHSRARVQPPPTYVSGPVLPNFYIHPWTEVQSAQDPDGRFVIIMGICVSTVSEESSLTATQALLSALRENEAAFLFTLAEFSGRYAILYGTPEAVRLVADATAMRSVFYATEGGVVASHALLVEQALGGESTRNRLPFRWGYPGNRTPFERTRLLPANILYELTDGRAIRYWPTQPRPSRTVDDVAEEMLHRSVVALRNVARVRPIKIALTAGLDSRTLIATALKADIAFETYTYGDGKSKYDVDRFLSRDFASALGIRHTLIPARPLNPALKKRLNEANYGPHHQNAAGEMAAWLDNPMAAAVSANLLEIGRGFYKHYRDRGQPSPVTAEAMALLHLASMKERGRRGIEAWGRDKYLNHAIHAFRGFLDDTDFNAARGCISPFDQFYWEHRMSAWHGPAMLERDFYAEPFIPFNSRSVFEAMLDLPESARDAGASQYRMVGMVDSRLLDFPINPVVWRGP